MRSIILSACALLALSTFASANQQALTRILTEASRSSNPSVTFLERVGGMGNVDMNAAAVQGAVNAAPVNAGLKGILANITGIKVSGNSVNITFSRTTSMDFAGRGSVRFSKNVRFRLRGRKLDKIKGFKIKGTDGPRVTPDSIEFKTQGGKPVAVIKALSGLVKRVVPLVRQSAEVEGMTNLIRIG